MKRRWKEVELTCILLAEEVVWLAVDHRLGASKFQ